MACIYGLKDPRTNRIKYIGKTSNIKQRHRGHLHSCYNNTKKECWIKSLKAKGLTPLFSIIEVVCEGEWQEREKWWISFYKTLGYELVNGTDGGDGGRLSDEIIQRNALKQVGKKLKKHKIFNSNKGVPLSPDHAKAISIAKKGKKRNDSDTFARQSKLFSKKVIQLTTSNEVVKIWDSLKSVERETGIGTGGIANVCVGRCKTAGGYKWMYEH